MQYDQHGGITWLPVVIVVIGAFAVVGWGLLVMRAAAHPPAKEALMNIVIPSIVPFYFHFTFLCMLFVDNIVMHLPALLAISLAMMAVSLVLHGWLLLQKLRLWQSPSQPSACPVKHLG